jgi:hypothetical protein
MVILALEHLHHKAQSGLHEGLLSSGETWFGFVTMLKIYWSPTCAPTWGILKKNPGGDECIQLIFSILKNLVIFGK